MNVFQFVENRGFFGLCKKCSDLILGSEIDDYIVKFVLEHSQMGSYMYCFDCGVDAMKVYIDAIEQNKNIM